MQTKPRMIRKSRRRREKGMPTKELLPVRLLVSGLGLEPRWLLNRLQNDIGFISFTRLGTRVKINTKKTATTRL